MFWKVSQLIVDRLLLTLSNHERIPHIRANFGTGHLATAAPITYSCK